jgi:predicted DNA-binding ribbon-helix-helix protein
MKEEILHTSIRIPKKLWHTVGVIAKQESKSASKLVVEMLMEKYGSVEVKNFV